MKMYIYVDAILSLLQPERCVCEALCHVNDDLRLDAFAVICSTNKKAGKFPRYPWLTNIVDCHYDNTLDIHAIDVSGQ